MDCSVVNSIDRDNRSGTFNNQGLRDGRRGKEYARWGVVRLVRAARDEILHEEQSSDTIAVPSVFALRVGIPPSVGGWSSFKLRLRAPLESAAPGIPPRSRGCGHPSRAEVLESLHPHRDRATSTNRGVAVKIPIEQRRECCYKRRRSTVNSTWAAARTPIQAASVI